jgi:AcrR family transcriptional regulator
MALNEQRQAKRRQEMLDAAMAIVVEESLEALTIARLAERLGAAVGALYRYFDSKEALLVGLQKEAIRLFHEAQLADLAEAAEQARETGLPAEAETLFLVLVGTTAYLDDARRAPRRHRLLDTMLSTLGPVLTDVEALEVAETLEPVLRECGLHLEEAVTVGALRPGDSAQRTHVLWAFLHGLDHFRKRDRIQPPPLQVRALLRLSLQTLLLGWGAEEPHVGAALDLLARFRLGLC